MTYDDKISLREWLGLAAIAACILAAGIVSGH